ncbi:AsmA family protein [Pararhizobium arenae]|uniref:AsmA family protein n=1 Tax=Pararhizobium arenae TaxID=1856850 RepID=UPI0009F82093|nr:AsmA-like C-terminal region-containing protein [Pararhizobium arenae]
MPASLRSLAKRDGWVRLLRSPFLRWTTAGLVLFLLFVKIALPLFISTPLIKDNMEAALSRWTGARATIVGSASISFWPGPALTLSDIRFETEETTAPFATAKAITADFDLLAALSGTPVFYDFHLLEPVLTVRRDAEGRSNWPTPLWMSAAIMEQSRAGSATPRGEPIGDIVIENGSIDFEDAQTGYSGRLDRIIGAIAWRSPEARLNANLGAIVGGEPVDLNLSVDAPMAFLAGRDSRLSAAIGSGPLQIAFDGTGAGGRYPGVNGGLQLSVPSLSGLARWFGRDAGSAVQTSSLALETTISTTANELKMDDLTLTMDGTNATGLMDLARRPGESHKLNGSLAFDKLQAETFAAFSPFLLSKDDASQQGIALLERLDVDLRLSAQTASYGQIVLTDLAAGIMSSGERTSIDIGDSGFAGGSLNGRISMVDGGTKGAEMQVSLKNPDFGALVQNLGIDGPTLRGEGTLSLDLATATPLNAATINDFAGDIRFRGGRGTLTRFDIDTFRSLIAQGRFFDSAAASDGAFPTQSSEIEAMLKDGVATLEKAEIRGEENTLVLTGVIPFHSNGLALAGSLTANDNSAPAVRFFAGGSWPNAVISPLSALPAQP